MKRIRSLSLAVFLLPFLAAACTTPGAFEIPVDSQPAEAEAAAPTTAPATAAAEISPRDASPKDAPAAPASMPATVAAAADQAELPVENLVYEGVNGGKAIYEVDGTPEEVLAMLLDFEHADGRRAWQSKYSNARREGDITTVHWHFHGKAGVDPDCDLTFTTLRRKSDIVLRFKEKEGVFGLAAFFGDYRLQAAGKRRTRVTARIFAASGLLIADASHEDIAAGLREDAKLTAEWMRERTAH